MSIMNFDNLKVTTMTVIVKIKGNTIIENIFPLLDITRLDLPARTRITKSYKIPFCGIPGAILSAKFQNTTRGIVKTKSKQSFLNSITLDICTSKKNINAKLSGGKIQMCGPDSEELAREAAQHIIDHLLNLQNNLDYISENKINRDDAIEWIKNNTEGQEYVIDCETQEIIELEEKETINEDGTVIDCNGKYKKKEKDIIFDIWNSGDKVINNILVNKDNIPYTILNIRGRKETAVLEVNIFIKTEKDSKGNPSSRFIGLNEKPIYVVITNTLKVMKVKSIIIPGEYPDKYPENINSKIVNFYIKYAPDFAYHHVFCQFLDGVKEIDKVATKDLQIEMINMAMINYSYSLTMSIDRWALANYINDLNGFKARYNNVTDHSVTISLPYKQSEEKINRRKNKQTKHTFMVHKSGIVTQSGPNIELMKTAYYLFMETINEIRDFIVQKGKPFKMKFVPNYETKCEVVPC